MLTQLGCFFSLGKEGTERGWRDRGKDEGWIWNKGGSGDVKTALLVEVLGVSLAALISEAIFRLCGDYCRFVCWCGSIDPLANAD